MRKKDPYRDLANAIVLQAVKDYRKICKELTVKPNDKKILCEKRSIEKFFRSKWFTRLCKMDGELLMQRLKKEA